MPVSGFLGLCLLIGSGGPARAVEPFGGLTSSDVAHELYERASQMMSSRRPLEAYFYPSDTPSAPGYFPRIEVGLDDVWIRGLRIAQGHMVLSDAQVDLRGLFARDRVAFHRVLVEGGEIVLEEQDLNEWIRREFKSGQALGLEARVMRQEVELTGRIPLGPFTPQAHLRVQLRVENGGRQLVLVPVGAQVGVFGGSMGAVTGMIQKLNPILDLETWGRTSNVDARLRSVELRPGAIQIRF